MLTCLWKNINKGVIHIAEPTRQNRFAMAPTIYLPVPRTTLFKKSVFYHGATVWNALPVNIRLSEDIESFKIAINNLYN